MPILVRLTVVHAPIDVMEYLMKKVREFVCDGIFDEEGIYDLFI